MSPPPGDRRDPSRRAEHFVTLGRRSCIGGAVFGLIGLVGALSGAASLTTIAPDQPPMTPNTALGLSLLGAAGALCPAPTRARRAVARVAAVVVLALALATLAEYTFAVDLRVDHLLLATGIGPYPGRPSPPTALALALLGAAVLLFDTRPGARAWPSECLLLSAALISFTALLGQIFGAGPLYRLADALVHGVAIPTAIALMLISLGLLLERPDRGLMRAATSPGPGGVMLRRLGVIVVVGPVLLGLILLRLIRVLGVEQFALVFASMSVVTSVVALVVLVVTAHPLDRMHAALEATRTRTQEMIDQAADGILVADLTGRYIEVNAAGCRMLGYSCDELLGKSIRDLLRPQDIERLTRHRELLLGGDTHLGEWLLRRKDGALLPVEISARILPDRRWQAIVRDISERKRAQDLLRQSMERFDLALRGADLGAWDWNVTTGEAVFNERWAEMRGYRLADIRPHVESWLSGVHPDDRPRVERSLLAHFRGLTPEYEAEHRVMTKSGDWLWILDRGRVFARDADGRPTRIVGTELDITARKRADEALRLSEAKFSGIVAVSADAIVSVDDQQRITLFNEGAERLFGHSRSDVVGQPLDILIPERFRAEHQRLVARFAASAQVSRSMNGHVVGLRKTGEEFPAEASISKFTVGSTRIFTVAIRDVSEQRQREREKDLLAEVGGVLAAGLDERATLSGIADAAVHGFSDACVVDLLDEGGEVHRLKVAHRAPSPPGACDLLARSPPARADATASVIATRRPILLSRLSPESLASLVADEEQRRALRALAPRSALAVPLTARDRVLGALMFLSTTPNRSYGPRDLHVAEEVAQRVALSLDNAALYRATQRAVKTRDEVLGIVAHDLRNPLGVVLLQAKLLLRRSEPGSRSHRCAETIERATRRMNRLIHDLLDVARMEGGRLSVDVASISAASLVAEAVDAQRALASSNSIALRSDVPPDLPEVTADHDRLIQVFENLIGNALKFTGPGGRITVAAAPRGPDEVLFSVVDTGAGIDPDAIPHLFDRFWQARQARRVGTGLGLAIVKGIVEAHGGRIWVESAPGRGSAFYFTIPAASHARLHAAHA